MCACRGGLGAFFGGPGPEEGETKIDSFQKRLFVVAQRG